MKKIRKNEIRQEIEKRRNDEEVGRLKREKKQNEKGKKRKDKIKMRNS